MAKINLDTEVRFKTLLKQFGFKKSGYFFIRQFGDTIQNLCFAHATHGQRHVRYYSCSYGFEFPKIMAIAKEIGTIPFGTGAHIGYLMPQYDYVEWRLAEDDSEEYYLNLIHEIVDAVKDYALPFMERYSTLRAYVEGAEVETFRTGSFDRKSVPIAYYLLGEMDNAMRYIDATLQRYSRNNDRPEGIEFIVTDEYEKIVVHPEPDINYVNYKDFTDKFLRWVEQQGKQR